MESKCLVDTNIFLDLYLKRERKTRILEILADFDSFALSAKSFTTIFYLLRKYSHSKEDIYEELGVWEIMPVLEQNCRQGYWLAKNANDVEECMELSIAKERGLTFITADRDLAKKYGQFCQTVAV